MSLRARLARALSGAARRIGGAEIISGYSRAVPRRGTRELLEAYRESPVLRAVVQRIAYMTAAQGWSVKAAMEGGQEIALPGHPLETLLMRGNPWMHGMMLRQTAQTMLDLVGEAFILLDRNRLGAPVRGWIIPPHWVMTVPQLGREAFEVRPLNGGQMVNVPPADMLWLRDPDPERPYERGAGIAAALGDELTADEAAAKHVASALLNRARPDLIISGTENNPFTPEDKARLEQAWVDRFSGPARSGRPFTSSGPIQITPIGQTFEQLQLKDLRAYERDLIVSVYGVPPEMLGILANSNRATIDAADHFMAAYVIRPRLRAWEAAINAQLAPQYDARIFACFDDPVQSDKAHALAVMQAAPGAFKVDEYRAAAGAPPLPDGAGEALFTPAAPLGLTLGPPLKSAKTARPALKAAYDPDDDLDDEETARLLADALREAVTTFAGDSISQAGATISFDIFDPRVIDWLAANALERSRLITGTTREALKAELADGVAAGESTAKLVTRIRKVFGQATEARAKLIARTEIVRASNFGATEGMRQAGVDRREWLATQDGHVRDTHRGLDGQQRGIDEPFSSSSGARGMYPGDFGRPEEDINCRCGVVPIIAGLSDKAARVAAWKGAEDRRAPLEARLEASLREMFAAQQARAIAKIEGNR